LPPLLLLPWQMGNKSSQQVSCCFSICDCYKQNTTLTDTTSNQTKRGDSPKFKKKLWTHQINNKKFLTH
jgi:hypothetical protein